MKNLILVLATFLLCSCDERKNEVRLATDSESCEYAAEFMYRINAFPNDILNNQFEISYFIDRLHEAGMPKSLTDYTLEYGLEGMVYNLGNNIASEIKAGRYDLISCGQDQDGKGVMLFRLYTSTGINYHEYHIVISDGVPKIGDLDIYATGEYLSQAVSRVIYSSLIDDTSVSEELNPKGLESIEALGNATDLVEKGNYEQAYVELHKAKAKFGNEKFWKVLYLTIVFRLDESKYAQLLGNFNNINERDPTWLLMGMDYCFLKEDWNGALEILNDLSLVVGYDPILEFYKSIVYHRQNNLTESYDHISNLPDYIYTIPDVLFTKLQLELSLTKYSEAVVSLDSISSYFGTPFNEVNLNDHPNFIESIEYQELVKRSN